MEKNALSSVKVILPGEFGFSDREKIGTFAAGAQDGCRAYLFFDEDTGYAGCIHSDFHDQDVPVAQDIITALVQRGAKKISYYRTRNSSANADAEISSLLGANLGRSKFLDSSEFLFDPTTKQVESKIDPAEKKTAFAARKLILIERLRTGDKSLLRID